jgi:hypothetical protein
LGWDTDDVTASYNGVSYKVADRGIDFRGYTPQTWGGSWEATAPVTFEPPPSRLDSPTSVALSCATPNATIFLQVTPDPGNDTNLVGVSGSPMAINGTYSWSGAEYVNDLDGAISLAFKGTNWSIAWAGVGSLYTSTNLYGAAWTATTNGVNPPPVTSATVGWHRYSKPVVVVTNTLIEAYAFTDTSFASATTNAAFSFPSANPLPVAWQNLGDTSFRFSWSTNAGTVHVLFSESLAGPWTNVYTGPGIIFGANGIFEAPITPPRGFYRFWR